MNIELRVHETVFPGSIAELLQGIQTIDLSDLPTYENPILDGRIFFALEIKDLDALNQELNDQIYNLYKSDLEILDALSDFPPFLISSPAVDDILVFNGTNWINQAMSGGIDIGTPIPSGTDNRIFFQSGGNLAQAADLTFDGVNLGVGTSSPTTRLHVNLNTSDYANTSGANSHLLMTNANGDGQTTVSSYINNTLAGKWRTDYDGNLNWVAGAGYHAFYTNGDYSDGGTPKMIISNDGKTIFGNGFDYAATKVDIRAATQALGVDVANDGSPKKWIEFTSGGRANPHGYIEYDYPSIVYGANSSQNTILKNTNGGRVGIGEASFVPNARLEIRGVGAEALGLDISNGSSEYYLRCTYNNREGTYGGLKQTGYGLQFDANFNFVFNPRSGGGGIYVGYNPAVYAPDHLLNIEPVTTSQGGLCIKTQGEHFRIKYDNSNYLSGNVGSTGGVSLNSIGSDPYFQFNAAIKPAQLSDFSAPDNSIYYSVLSNTLVYKDASSVVHDLY